MSTRGEKYRKLLQEIEADSDYGMILSKLQFLEGLERLMEKDEVNRTKLAERAGIRPPTVTKALRRDKNISIRMMNKLAAVLGARIHIHVERREVVGEWIPASDTDSADPGVATTADVVKYAALQPTSLSVWQLDRFDLGANTNNSLFRPRHDEREQVH